MEIYLLDSLLRRIEVVDKFESMLWTERFAEIGDFELNIMSSRQSRSQFIPGTKIAINNSYRVMTVETLEDKTDPDGKKVLNVKGRSLEYMLKERVAKGTMSNLTDEPEWWLAGLPANIARKIFNDICVLGNLDPADVIPFMMPGTILPVGTIPEPATPIVAKIPLDSVLNAVQNICKIYDLGFRLVRNFDASQLYFDIYTGDDRTTKQSVFPPVIFAPDFDNLQNTTELTNIQDSSNVAYVFSEVGYKVVYPDGVNPDDVRGFDRRVLYVNASDVTADTVNIDGALTQAGKEALLQNRTLSAFDGELLTAEHINEFSRVKNLLENSNPEFASSDFKEWTTKVSRIPNPAGFVLSHVPPDTLRLTSTVDGFNYAGLLGAPVVPGVTYTWSHDVMPDVDSEDQIWVPVMNYYAADETTLVGQYTTADWTNPSTPLGVFTRVGMTSVAPAGAAIVDLFICTINGTTTGKGFLVKKLQLAEGPIMEYSPKQPYRVRPYRYGTDYNLGDLVELRNEDGVITDRRVSEQIFVCDQEGERSYPTLMANDFIMGGTWLTMGDKVWADYVDEHWEDF